MDIRIKSSLYKEKELLQDLLDALDVQYSLLTVKNEDKDIVAICSIAEKIDSIAKSIAIIEIERRKIISNEDLISQIENSDDSDSKNLLKDISKVKRLVDNQNEINNTFVKQNLFFTKKMLKIITPSENFNTYNNLGKLGLSK